MIDKTFYDAIVIYEIIASKLHTTTDEPIYVLSSFNGLNFTISSAIIYTF